jgi:hypothetical protein
MHKAFRPLDRPCQGTFIQSILFYPLAFMNALHVSAKSTQKLSAAPFASKVFAKASLVNTATAKAELGVNGCLCLG